MIKGKIKNMLLAVSAAICRNHGSKILYYHDVHAGTRYTDMGTPLSLFKQHIDAIRQCGFDIVEAIIRPEKEVMICFDDGFRGIYDVKDFFIGNGIRPTVFLPVSLIGKPGYLSIDEIRELQEAGFRFQSHAWSHTDLTAFAPNELARELGASKQCLEGMLGTSVTEICFPIGYFSQNVIDECRRYGYTKMYSSIPGNYHANLRHQGLLARNLAQYASPWQVKAMLHGGNELLVAHYRKLHFRK